MSGWSGAVEKEREELLEQFYSAAKDDKGEHFSTNHGLI